MRKEAFQQKERSREEKFEHLIEEDKIYLFIYFILFCTQIKQ